MSDCKDAAITDERNCEGGTACHHHSFLFPRPVAEYKAPFRLYQPVAACCLHQPNKLARLGTLENQQ